MVVATKQLKNAILLRSESSYFEDAVNEWDIVDCSIDRERKSVCICGHDHIYYTYTIRNRLNGNNLFPIGSDCIKKFGSSILNEELSMYSKMIRILEAYNNGERIELNSEKKLFSRKFLEQLYNEGCFTPDRYNFGNGKNDFEFLLSMFNRRSEITSRQYSKIMVIINKKIIPFIKNYLNQ